MASPRTEITIGKHIFCIRFAPQSQAVHTPGWGPDLALHWVLEIRSAARRHDAPPYFLYSQGVGHIPGYFHHSKPLTKGLFQQYVEAVCETGRRFTGGEGFKQFEWTPKVAVVERYGKPLPFPKVGDILRCLMLDAEAVSVSFDDWCWAFGYDSDSIKALKTYEACVGNGRKLIKAFGREVYNQLLNIYAEGEDVWNEQWEAVLRGES